MVNSRPRIPDDYFVEEEGLEIRHLLQVFRRRIKVFLLVFSVVFFSAAFFGYNKFYKQAPSLYKAVFKMRLEPRLESKRGQEGIYVVEEKYDLESFLNFIQSDYIIEKVLERVYKGEINDENFVEYMRNFRKNSEVLPKTSSKGIKKVEITPKENIATISISAENPQEAYALAQAWSEVIAEEERKRKERIVQRSINVLEEQLKNTEKDLNANRNKLSRFVLTNSVLAEAVKDGKVIVDPEKISSQFLELKNKIATLESFEKEINKIKEKEGYFAAYKFILKAQKGLVDKSYLKEYEEVKDILENALLINRPQHPDVVKARRNLNIVEKKIKNEVEKVLEYLSWQTNDLRRQKNRIDALIQKGLIKAILTYQKLKESIAEQEKKYKELNTELNNLRLTSKLTQNTSFSMIQTPNRPYEPYNTKEKEQKKLLVFVVAFFLAGFIGYSTISALEAIDVSVKDIEDLEAIGWVVLASIPYFRQLARAKEGKIISRDYPRSVVAEAFRALRVNLKFIGADRNIKTVAVTSSVAGEGKTSVAINLAATLAAGGEKTLLIEADMRRPTFFRYFKTENKAVAGGLRDLLSGKDIAPQKSEEDNLWVIPAGAPTNQTEKILTQRKLVEIINRWKGSFDWIIFDSPPLQGAGDSVIIMKSVDCVVPVVLANKTLQRVAARSKSMLEMVKVNVIGAVLNGVGKLSDYGYYYYGKEK